MTFVIGVLGSLVPRLLQLLQDEYKLQKGVKKQVQSLAEELESMHAALCMVAQVTHEELDLQVKLWARYVLEASYDMENVTDTFLLRVDSDNQTVDADKAKVNRLVEKMGKMFNVSKIKARRDTASTIEGIKKGVEEISMGRDWYRIDRLADLLSVIYASSEENFNN